MTVDAMIIASHPDDAEIGMGGTIISMLKSGMKLTLVDLTNGEPTPYGSPEIRKNEWENASKILGLKNRVNLGLNNRCLVDDVPSRKLLAEAIREYRPKILFTPYWEDAHPDHIAANQLANSARFYAKLTKWDIKGEPYYPGKIFHYFCTHRKVQFIPSFLHDISGHIDTKLASIKAYHSQFVANPKNLEVLDQIKTFNSYWGQQGGVKYAEPFICQEAIIIKDANVLLNA
jgi:bacillithiol biosynthesis deacetylase BshB1